MDNKNFYEDDEIVTLTGANGEEMRSFPNFMIILPATKKQCPKSIRGATKKGQFECIISNILKESSRLKKINVFSKSDK